MIWELGKIEQSTVWNLRASFSNVTAKRSKKVWFLLSNYTKNVAQAVGYIPTLSTYFAQFLGKKSHSLEEIK